jgi:uncharacterized Zn finger protein
MPPTMTFPVVTCPGCGLPMEPLVSESGPNNLMNTTYRCKKCGAETERLHKSDNAE